MALETEQGDPEEAKANLDQLAQNLARACQEWNEAQEKEEWAIFHQRLFEKLDRVGLVLLSPISQKGFFIIRNENRHLILRCGEELQFSSIEFAERFLKFYKLLQKYEQKFLILQIMGGAE